MNTLVLKAGLNDAHYRGGWKNSKRHGYGIQLFPNGARYIGNWKHGSAEGFGRLEFIEGTFYEGNFCKNFIQEGKLQYFNGTCFEGVFHPTNDLFRSGKITFRDREVLQAAWNADGQIESAVLFQTDGKTLKMRHKTLIRDETYGVSAKIVYYNKGIIYEGGLLKENYDRKGFVYGNYKHPFYFECNYKKQKCHGRYIYHSFSYGFTTEEYYDMGKEVKTWHYRTVKGYEYTGDTASKKQQVRFPFLNRDYYEGELSMWCENITLVSGTYSMFEKDKNTYRHMRVIDCSKITENKEIRKRFFSFEEMQALVEDAKYKTRRENLRCPDSKFFLEDGSAYTGQIINNFVTCHKDDLSELLVRNPNATAGNVRSQNQISSSVQIFQNINRLKLMKFFRGTMVEGLRNGYCDVVFKDNSTYSGFFKDDKEHGSGIYHIPEKYRFEGSFIKGKMHGQGTLNNFELNRVFKGPFVDGLMKGLGYIKYCGNNLEYFGEVVNNLRWGKGVLKFINNFKFEGFFMKDKIDTTKEPGRIVSRELDLVEEGDFVSSQNELIGFFETKEGKFFVFDLRNGVVRQTS